MGAGARDTTTYCPSGVHSGDRYRLVFPYVICFVAVVVRSMVQTLSPPSRSDVNTTNRPSGEKRGCASYIMPRVNAVAVPPAIGIVYRSPSRSNTIVRPSGLTSREIQLPSSVSRLIERVGRSGRSGLAGAACARTDVALAIRRRTDPRKVGRRMASLAESWYWGQLKIPDYAR